MWSSRTTRSRGAEGGFVLATTLLVTTLLTVMLAASFLLVSAEQRTTDNSFGTARALALAQAGLQNYFSANRALSDTTTYDSIHVVLANGYADVVATRLRPIGSGAGSARALYVVRSTAVATSPVMAGSVQGSRTIAQFALKNAAAFPSRAMVVALNGVYISGASGTHPVSGSDLGSQAPCVSPGHPAADTVAISTPSVVPIDGLAGYRYAVSTPTPVYGRIENYFPAWSNLYDSTHVDWSGIVAGSLVPDYTVTNASPVGAWPPILGTNYQVGFVPKDSLGHNQDITIPVGQRRGVLVVTGNVRLLSGSHWDGIILAGGNLVIPSGLVYYLHGMVVTGLNIAVGQSVLRDTLPRTSGTTYIQWTWCYTQSSINSLSSLVPIKNGWADTWSTY
jgi:hypothetical protein